MRPNFLSVGPSNLFPSATPQAAQHQHTFFLSLSSTCRPPSPLLLLPPAPVPAPGSYTRYNTAGRHVVSGGRASTGFSHSKWTQI